MKERTASGIAFQVRSVRSVVNVHRCILSLSIQFILAPTLGILSFKVLDRLPKSIVFVFSLL